MDFKAFPKIQPIDRLHMTITQKIHGTNAHIYVYKSFGVPAIWVGDKKVSDALFAHDIKVGSRTRWITPEDDNYGFAAFVHEHKDEFIEKLGPGHHFGEWAGPGINSGEGLSEKTFILFNHRRWKDKPLPPQTTVVPVLHTGRLDMVDIDLSMLKLKQEGSQLAPGFMRPEGIVIEIGDQLYKKVFEPEDTGWMAKDKTKAPKEKYADPELDRLLQPIRLEKLLSRDETYIREYPASIPSICRDYIQDLVEEQQIIGDEDQIMQIKRQVSGRLFHFIKQQISNHAPI